MTPLAMAVLGAFVAVLCTGREANADAKTWTQLWAPARSKGWRRATLLALGGTFKLLLLVTAGVTVLTLNLAAHAGRAAALVCGALAWHLAGITAYAASPPPQLMCAVREAS